MNKTRIVTRVYCAQFWFPNTPLEDARMKKLSFAVVALALCLAVGAPALADHHNTAQEGSGQPEGGMPPMGPPPEMKMLDILNGEYAIKFYFKMNPTDAEWVATDATAVVSVVAGGATQQMLFEGHMMGMPFSGLGLTSYDRETSKWTMTWVDSMGARISVYTGTFDDGKLVVTGKDLNQGVTIHSRLSTYNITEKGFDWLYEMSMDGAHYFEGAKATYTKK